MDFENLKEGQSIQKPPKFDKENFLEWKNKFENYVRSIDQDLWHVISIGDFKPTKTSFENQNGYPKLYKNNKAKIMIYKALPRYEYERVFLCQTANDIWKNILNRHEVICQVKDDQFDLTYELGVLGKLINRHLLKNYTCTTSLNVLNEGTSKDEYVCLGELACESREEKEVEEDNDPIGNCQSIEATSKVSGNNKHACFDTFILESSKEENESKHLGNTNLKTISKNKYSKAFMNHFEKGKKSDKFNESTRSLEKLLKSQKSFQDKTGLGFNSKESSTSKTKQVNFVKAKREV